MIKSQSRFQKEKKRLSSSEDVALSSKKIRFSYPEDKEEAMPIRFYDQVPHLILGYLDGDICPITMESKTKARTQQYAQFKLFGCGLRKIMKKDDISSLAKLILHGEEKEIEEVLEIVKKKPILLHIETEANDLLGRPVRGTLLKIAVMAGDVDLWSDIQDEKERGIVERLIAAGNLSREEVADQLQCLTSKKAIKENEKRNQRILAFIKRFGKGIIKKKASQYTSFESYQIRCKSLIDQLEKNLQPDTKAVITEGYVFDPKILYMAAKWYEENVVRFGGCEDWVQKETFWLGIGKLQSLLSSRDAQVARAGIGDMVDKKTIPKRTLNNSERSSLQLGVDFYLGYHGEVRPCLRPSHMILYGFMPLGLHGRFGGGAKLWETLYRSKNSSIEKFMQYTNNSNEYACLIM